MYKTKLLLLASLFFLPTLLVADCTNNSPIVMHGGHYYSVTATKMTFSQAKRTAEDMGGYLAIPNDASENSFIQSLIGGNSNAWIGIYDPQQNTNYCYEATGLCANDDSRFRDINLAVPTYTNWASGEPNNFVYSSDVIDGIAQTSPLGEHWVTMFGNSGLWGDYGKHAGINDLKIAVFEFEQEPDCYFGDPTEPTLEDFEKFCNAEIYDSETGDLTIQSETKECLVDQYNTDYCPIALAPASTYWDYTDSVIYTHTDVVEDFATGSYQEHMGSVRDFVDGTSEQHVSTETVYNNGTSATYASIARDWTSAVASGQTLSQCHYAWYRTGTNIAEWEVYTSVPSLGTARYAGFYKNRYYWATPNCTAVVSPAAVTAPGRTTPGYISNISNSSGCRAAVKVEGGNELLEDSGFVSKPSIGQVKYIGVYAQRAQYVDAGCVIYTSPTHIVPNGQSVPYVLSNTSNIYTPSYSCPSGYTLSSGKCYKNVLYNHYTYGCPIGYTPQNTGMATCTKTDPNTSVRNDTTLDDACNSQTPPANNCVAVLNQTAYEYVCGTGYIPIDDGLTECPSGTDGECNSEFPPESNCYKDISYKYYEYECPPDYIIDNHGLQECVKTDPNLTINNEATLNDDCNQAEPPIGNCRKTIEYSFYEFACESNLNFYSEDYEVINTGLTECERIDQDLSSQDSAILDDPCNSTSIANDNCQRLNYTCNSTMREPAWVDGQWQCSPFPCRSQEEVTDHTTNFRDQELSDDGWNENGGCDGQIYIFDGDASKCISWEVGGITDCCGDSDRMLGLMDCSSGEKMLAEKKDAGMCHYIGEFCSKSIEVGFDDICVQKSQGHCCYNSKLSRILNVGAKAQLGKNFGTARSPDCQGFTPEEFQRIDLSQIDLSEFVADIQSDFDVSGSLNSNIDSEAVINEQLQQSINNSTSNLGNNIGTRVDTHFDGIQ